MSSQITVRSGCFLVRLLSGQTTIFSVSVYWDVVCRGYVLGEVPVEILSGWAALQILLFSGGIKTSKARFLLHFVSSICKRSFFTKQFIIIFLEKPHLLLKDMFYILEVLHQGFLKYLTASPTSLCWRSLT